MNEFMLNLQLFADPGDITNINVSTQSGIITPEMKTYYDTAALENEKTEQYFAQFGRKQRLPANHGVTVEWRRPNELPTASVLTEGVIPDGTTFGYTALTSSIVNRGMYVPISKTVMLHAVDPVLQDAVEGLGVSFGQTEDIAIRNEVLKGTNVMYADTLDSSGNYSSTPLGRYQMSASNNKLTPKQVAKVVTFLKKLKAKGVDGSQSGRYVCILPYSVAEDLRVNNDEWIDYHKYAATEEIFNGEIGMLHGVRFIESPNAKVWSGEALTDTNRYLTCTATYIENDTTETAPDGGVTSAYKLTIAEAPTADLVGRLVHIYDDSAAGYVGTVEILGVDIDNKYLWLDDSMGITPTANDLLYPGEGGAEGTSDTTGTAVYACLFMGFEPYGIIDPEGGGMEMIIKTAQEIGGPLNQFGTAGYTFESGTKVLYETRIVRLECCSSYSNVDETN